MKIAFINMPIEFYSPVSGGAIATIIAQTGKELISAGHEVTVLTSVNGDAVYDIGQVVPLATKGRNDLSFPARRLSDVRRRLGRWDWPYFEFYLASLKRRLREIEPPDLVILFNDLYSPPEVRRILPNARIAVWLQNECRTDPRNLPETTVATDTFFTCSAYIRDWTARTHGIDLEKFAVIHSGVDLDQFNPSREPRSGPPLRVLFVGRLDPNKGPDIAADAVATLRSEGIDITFTVAGAKWFYGDDNGDPYIAALKARLASIGANYLGHVTREKIAEVYRNADVVCVLSRSNEPFGLVVLEAMASGCAVIASNRGGLPEACGGAGILVDPEDLGAVAQSLRSLSCDPRQLERQQELSIKRSASASWGKVANGLIQGLAVPVDSSLIGSTAASLG